MRNMKTIHPKYPDCMETAPVDQSTFTETIERTPSITTAA